MRIVLIYVLIFQFGLIIGTNIRINEVSKNTDSLYELDKNIVDTITKQQKNIDHLNTEVSILILGKNK